MQVHKDTVQAEWQAFLNLCLTQETHLDNINFYKQVEGGLPVDGVCGEGVIAH